MMPDRTEITGVATVGSHANAGVERPIHRNL